MGGRLGPSYPKGGAVERFRGEWQALGPEGRGSLHVVFEGPVGKKEKRKEKIGRHWGAQAKPVQNGDPRRGLIFYPFCLAYVSYPTIFVAKSVENYWR